jgi:TetR/AcrR family transcriptional regulator, transcriptional repressor for nem operon
MSGPENPPGPQRLTSRGAATRARIIGAAADLMRVKGVNATTLDDVLAASGASKSQLYRHFAAKEALVREVVALQGRKVLEREQQQLGRLNSFSGLRRWRNVLVQLNALHDGAYGCVLGSMANEIADQDEEAQASLVESFVTWESLIADGLRRMQVKGTLKPGADPDMLATGLIAALQGGYLLAQTARNTRPMEAALDMALGQVKAHMADDVRGCSAHDGTQEEVAAGRLDRGPG